MPTKLFFEGHSAAHVVQENCAVVLGEVKRTLYEGRYMMCPLAREEEGAKSFLDLSANLSNEQAVCRKQLNLEIYKTFKKEKNVQVFIVVHVHVLVSISFYFLSFF